MAGHSHAPDPILKAPFSRPPKTIQSQLIARPVPHMNVNNAVVRRPLGYGQTQWPILAQYRFLHPSHSKIVFRTGWAMRWGAVAALAAYWYVPYADWYVRNGWKFITGQEYEAQINTDRSRFFNYSY